MALAGLLAFALAATSAPIAMYFLRRAGVLDRPNERSLHVSPVPRGAGIPLAVSALLTLAVFHGRIESRGFAVVIVAGGFAGLGALEDLRGVTAQRRLAFQVGIAALSVPLLLRGYMAPPVWRAVIGVGVVIWLVGFANCFNFMDGINGISVAQAIVGGTALMIAGQTWHVSTVATGGIICIAVALGFAPLNFPRARCFLGDSGSYFLGAWLGTFVVLGWRSGIPPEALLGSLTIYVADAAATLIRRAWRREPWWMPHKTHVYQQLVARGWSHTTTAATVTVAMTLCGALGTLSGVSHDAKRIAFDGAIGLVVTIYLTAPHWLQSISRRLTTAAI